MAVWETLGKIVSIFVWIFVIIAVTLGIVAYFVVKAGIAGAKKLVGVVKTASSKTIAELKSTLKKTEGVIQGVKHNFGDLISVLRTDSERGIYQISQNFELTKTNITNTVHTIQDGIYKDSQAILHAKEGLIHLLQSAGHIASITPEFLDRTVSNLAMNTISFAIKDLDTAVLNWNYQATTSTAFSGLAGTVGTSIKMLIPKASMGFTSTAGNAVSTPLTIISGLTDGASLDPPKPNHYIYEPGPSSYDLMHPTNPGTDGKYPPIIRSTNITWNSL